MKHFQLRSFLFSTAFVVWVVAVSGCKQVIAPQASPPPTVTVSRPVRRDVIRWDQYSGYLSSPQTVTVSARVGGLIEEAPFQEGAIVHAGDLLFKIDPRPFKADLDNKQATVAQAKASAAKAQADHARNTALLRDRVIAQSDYDTTKAT